MNSSISIPLLIVEDSPVYAEILLQLLPSLGSDLQFNVKWVETAEAALAELDHTVYELALLDYKLPGADGLSLLTHIQLMPYVRRPAVIMLTGIGREEIAVEAMKSGAKDYLSKDHLDVPSLLRAITSALDRKHIEDALAQERALLRALMDNAPDHIYFKDSQSRFTHISASHARDLGLKHPEDALGKTDDDFFPPDFAHETRDDEHRIVENGQPVIGKEEFVTYPDGKTRWISATKVPLRDRSGNIIGLVGVSRDITIRKKLEDQLAIAASELALKNSQMQADLELAREIQEAFLPANYPTFPAGTQPEQSALQFCHHYRPTTAIGGDFFDIFAISDTTAGVILCDVMGHGVRAALVTAILRTLIEQFKPLTATPGQFLTAINSSIVAILKQTKMPMFASAFYLVADTARGELRCASAGHHAPWRIPRDDKRATPLAIAKEQLGPALGIFDNARYTATTHPIARGDRILLFTDGLYEVEDNNAEHFGEDRLLTAVNKYASAPPNQMLDKILADIEAFAGRTEFSDDLCVVTVEAK